MENETQQIELKWNREIIKLKKINPNNKSDFKNK